MQNHTKITKLLIANRGEIARRVIKACSEMGIQSVVAVSDVDAESLAAREATEVARIGGQTAAESYLNQTKIIEAARSMGCQAIHPGYGFLSENAEFAEAVREAGLIFVGPSPESIRALGVKTTARRTVSAAGVPITPGSEGAESDEALIAAAIRIGFPVIIKAAAGGGGRGMRIVRAAAEMKEAIERARSEAQKNFGSPEVYCEKFIEGPRHVEVQLFGDQHGNVVHFGTRDCSAQRRHQKLVEEAPAPFLDEDVRERIHNAAVTAAKTVGYYNAGTAEFLVSGRDFYFLEINTRIQVEHPITEIVTETDLVHLQLRVAMGEKLPMRQSDISFTGHAIELRINAEDVCEGFRPALGTISEWRRQESPYVREDYGYREGDTIPPFYDSLVSKVIVRGESRQAALYNAFQYLKGYSIGGLPTTIPFHAWILANADFQTAGIDIGYVERTFTAGGAREALSLLQTDTAHREPQGADNYVESVEVVGRQGERTKVELVHEPGGTFLAIPLKAGRERCEQTSWCRSNSRVSALEGVENALKENRTTLLKS
ncbi:MAG: acetyl-CoA carboxylase biotin carboxylase subunit [Pseudomonadota bacterium]